MIIVYLVNEGMSSDVDSLAEWAIKNPIKGLTYLSLLFILGIPLTFPPLLLLLFGSYVFA